ncbi:MAG TPA: TolC family protein [Verrucomicrobiae bacterium]|jgi:outer membrane protein TolC|nr:TolC family protein [Verrucomicrobiae bacterium]
MRLILKFIGWCGGVGLAGAVGASPLLDTNVPPLSRADAVAIALRQNTAIRKGQTDLRAAYGIEVQLRSIIVPKFLAAGDFNANDPSLVAQFPSLPQFPISRFIQFPTKNWAADVRVQESIYEGGRITSSFRSAKLTRQQALLNYQTVVADTILQVRVAYDDALLARQQIDVHEASVKLLTHELDDAQQRFDAGAAPQFNVLRAQVEVANEKPQLIQARNHYRIAKNNLVNLLGYDVPQAVWEDIPLQLTDELAAVPLELDLPSALARALQRRPELGALRKAEALRREDVTTARAGYKPNAQIFGGYEWQSFPYADDLSRDLSGWVAGAQVSWNLFDGTLTRGRVIEAQARYDRARIDVEETRRQIELEVRTADSEFIQARELLESQKKVQEQAAEALRQSEVRLGAGTGAQLDVLAAQTALTQSRTTQIQALHDYSVARARLQRALGDDMEIQAAPK